MTTSGYRSPRDPARVLPERRKSVEIDTARTPPGSEPRLLTDLNPRQRTLFDAQAAAYSAAIDYVNAVESYLQIDQYGPLRNSHLAVIKDREARWRAARDAWMWLRGI